MDGNRRKGVFNEFSVMDVANSKSIYGYGFFLKKESPYRRKCLRNRMNKNRLSITPYPKSEQSQKGHFSKILGAGVFDAFLDFGYI